MAGVHTFPDGTEVWQDDYWEAFEETGSQEGAINLLKQYGADEGGALGLGTGNMGLQRYSVSVTVYGREQRGSVSAPFEVCPAACSDGFCVAAEVFAADGSTCLGHEE